MRKLKVKENLSIPGIKIPELLELQDYLPLLRENLVIISVILCAIGQIRLNNVKYTAETVKKLESVNYYIRNFLAKSDEVMYVAAAVALRSTMVVYRSENAEEEFMDDFKDLVTNLNGKSSTRFGLNVAISSPSKLRVYRRGIILRVLGTLQSKPIHSPKLIYHSLDTLTYADLQSCLPFNVEDIDFNKVLDIINTKLGTKEDPLIFNEFTDVIQPMEKVLFIKRDVIKIINEKDLLLDQKQLDKAPKIKQLAFKQLKSIKSIQDEIL